MSGRALGAASRASRIHDRRAPKPRCAWRNPVAGSPGGRGPRRTSRNRLDSAHRAKRSGREAGWLHGGSRRLAQAGSAPGHAVARGSDSNGDAFSLDGLDDRLRAERALLQFAASGHEGRNHSIFFESDFPGDFVDPAAEGRSQLGDDEVDVEVRFGRGLAADPRAEHSKILDLHTLREAPPQLLGNLTVRSVHSGHLCPPGPFAMAVLYDLSGLEPPGVLTAVNLETEGRFGSRSG